MNLLHKTEQLPRFENELFLLLYDCSEHWVRVNTPNLTLTLTLKLT
jgi:hypothetical protein